MAHTLLAVPVPEAEDVARHAHITLLSPFAAKDEITEGILSELDGVFADVVPFAFQLTGVARFPGGRTYLTPEPVAPFRSLTHELFRRFPEHPPYGGEFDDVVPHLSVPDEVADRVRLPIAAYARSAVLWAYDGQGIEPLEEFPFGTSAA